MAWKKYRVINGRLNVRKDKDLGSPVAKVLDNGAVVSVSTVKDGWAKVGGGYVKAEFIEPVVEE